ncbi:MULTISPECIES: chemotaxis protein CheB [Dyella]|uniref:protein-glutamate methylesterase n=2 Tax=Dyella TaxID=231454 RepID=A0A4R0YSM7_9GAMM|nr:MULTISPECIES: chemotaxis protein CheB [Dyella]TBR40186.1 chemotaxis protein CheB [Dyella terrae]TCI12232.1 chemotaxis protein CheB [Dyella soli]
MADAAPAVALLFDDVELGGHLREALRERGARIVHEGTLAALTRDALASAGAQVVVVNLDDDAADELDRLYDVIDGDQPRVVFNDAQASRGLDGWDRARWARHLAVKVMAEGDIDPPRPADAPAFEPSLERTPVAAPEPVTDNEPPITVDTASAEFATFSFAEPTVDEAEPASSWTAVDVPVPTEAEQTAEASESLAAELEALLAADDVELAEDDFGRLKYDLGDVEVTLHDGDFGSDVALHDGHFGAPESFETQGPAPIPPPLPVAESMLDATSAARPSFQLDHLSLAPLDDTFMPSSDVVKVEKMSASEALHSGWSLVDDETPLTSGASATAASAPASSFAVEKVSAADFLAPEGGDETESFLQPGMSLELVSIEEAIAPQDFEHGGNEFQLGELEAAISRVLLLGATSESTDSVCAFLAALPSSLRMTVLHIQHQGLDQADAVADRLAAHSALPVRVATPGLRARSGEVLVVPAGRQVRLLRDGKVESDVVDIGAQSPSIDSGFTTAANVFGRNALAIVFTGPSTDAVAGAQAIHDRGGKVWVELSNGEHFADMVHGVEAERLASFSGTPFELAAHLVEEFSVEALR